MCVLTAHNRFHNTCNVFRRTKYQGDSSRHNLAFQLRPCLNFHISFRLSGYLIFYKPKDPSIASPNSGGGGGGGGGSGSSSDSSSSSSSKKDKLSKKLLTGSSSSSAGSSSSSPSGSRRNLPGGIGPGSVGGGGAGPGSGGGGGASSHSWTVEGPSAVEGGI